MAKYRFGFILSTSLGNLTRYQILRKYAERDPNIDFVWAPVKQYIGPGERDPFRRLPGAIRTRAIVLYQSLPVLSRLSGLDAVMIHMFEIDIITAIRGYVFKSPLRVISTDDAPAIDAKTYPIHPVELKKSAFRRSLRLRIDLWRVRRADLLIPFSQWACDIMVRGAGISPAVVQPIHVGMDLERWRYVSRPPVEDTLRIKVLFVGGDFDRKGGAQLLEAFARHLSDIAELHLVTKTAPAHLPPHVHLYDDIDADDPRLVDLYRRSDVLALPTKSDLIPWVVLEAMASGLPVVVTPVGGIVDLVIEGDTGIFIPVGDVDALAGAITQLAHDPKRRRDMGERARRFIEQNYDASVNVAKILEVMKSFVDSKRSAVEARRQ